MSEMIERVAKAIYEATAGPWTGVPWGEAEHDEPLRQARAAIQAMREPTEAMVAAAPPTHGVDAVGGRFELLHGGPRSTWRAMANAALA